MKAQRRFINQLMPGETLDQVFMVRDKDLRTAANGGLYVTCTLCDKTGTVPARMWQVSESIYNSIPAGGFLQIKGRSESYKGTLQVIIDACRPVAADKVEMADYLAATTHDIDEMWAELMEIVREIKDPDIKLLMKKFVEDRDLTERFKKAPAAMQLHQALRLARHGVPGPGQRRARDLHDTRGPGARHVTGGDKTEGDIRGHAAPLLGPPRAGALTIPGQFAGKSATPARLGTSVKQGFPPGPVKCIVSLT